MHIFSFGLQRKPQRAMCNHRLNSVYHDESTIKRDLIRSNLIFIDHRKTLCVTYYKLSNDRLVLINSDHFFSDFNNHSSIIFGVVLNICNHLPGCAL